MIDPGDVRDVFDRAASLPPQDRAAFLARACGDNVALRQEVERLLATDGGAGSPFTGDSSSGSAPADSSEAVGHVLSRGTRLGPYVIVTSLGAGGMGEVYKARDTRLDRSVAIKVLPPDRVGSAEARQRFEREAKAAAALAHAHICRLLDVGRSGDVDYLVMELLEGETLAARLLRGRLSLRQSLTVATQIAGALVVAHRAGIVHRDLKPGNIMLTPEGAVLLDFGLARQTAPIAMDAPTQGPITRTGVVLGTVQYMAPEQLEGRDVDARTDIFAFGAVLYEMVTGRRPFEGSNPASVIGNIMHAEPPSLTSIESTSPPALDRLVRTCLAKSPGDRFQSAADVKARLEALVDVIPGKQGGTAEAPHRIRGVSHFNRRNLLASLGVALLGLAVWTGYRYTGHPQSAQIPVQRSLTRLTFNGDSYGTFSPDGRFMVAMCGGHLCVQPVGGGNSVQVTKSTALDGMPDWSPDGTSIVLVRMGEGTFLVSPLGGQERKLASLQGYPAWSPDGTQVLSSVKAFREGTQLFLIAPGHAPRQILSDFLDGGEWGPAAWHPDGRITMAGRHKTQGFGIYTLSVDGGRWTKTTLPAELLAGTNIDPTRTQVLSWGPTGQFLYLTAVTTAGVGNVWRLQLDEALHVTALQRMTTGPGSDWWPRVSRDGKRMLFTINIGDTQLWSYPYSADKGRLVGTPRPLSEEDGSEKWPAISADGRRLAYYYAPLNATLQQSELRLSAFPFTNGQVKIQTDRFARMASAWSHDGKRLAVQAVEPSSSGTTTGNLLLIREDDGSEHVVGQCRDASPAEPCGIVPVSWTPDDSAILCTTQLGKETRTSLTLWNVAVVAPGEAPHTLIADAEWNIRHAAYSADRRWLAFSYGGAFKSEKGIAIVRASGDVPRTEWHQVAEGFEGLGNPSWSPDGHSLYFTSTRSGPLNVWRVPVSPATGTQAGSPVPAFKNVDATLTDYAFYPRMAMSADLVVLPKSSQKQAVWMLDNVDK